MPNKTKHLGPLKIERKFFADFLRDHFDGDGYIHSYYDPRWRSSYMVYLNFLSASYELLQWMQEQIIGNFGVRGVLKKASNIYGIRFAKYESLHLLKQMYPSRQQPVLCLDRKFQKIQKIRAEVLKLVNRHA